MAKYTAADVKALRERTGAGMLDCKKALDGADGDIEKAIEILREHGLKGVSKREDRTTENGLVAAKVDGERAYLIELACETDFVAKAERFITLGDTVLDAVASFGAETVDAALAAPLDGRTVAEVITDESAVIGEKLALTRIAKVNGEKFAIYLHRTNPDLPPQVGVVIGYSGGDSDTARSLAQHIAFADPTYLTREDVPADLVDKEHQIAEEAARNEGKPEAALQKIVEGRVTGFYKQVVLLDQPYAHDSKVSVQKVLDDAQMSVSGFARFRVGSL
ncbi:MAG TPA: elongation factor Ts [Pseudoclavibacter sp.]|nr:elongation factor Ts [Pseudoclavibacter sp.]